jgi:hypothetical protein
MAKLIFVNGYYNNRNNWLVRNFIGRKGGKEYWSRAFIKAATDYFSGTTANDLLFIDGRAKHNSKGGQRFRYGYDFAQSQLKTAFQTGEEINVVSHSQGGAYAEGMIQYLIENENNVKKVIHFSATQGHQFQVNPETYSLQLEYKNDPVILFKLGYKVINKVDKYGKVDTGTPRLLFFKDWRKSHKRTKFYADSFTALKDLETLQKGKKGELETVFKKVII